MVGKRIGLITGDSRRPYTSSKIYSRWSLEMAGMWHNLDMRRLVFFAWFIGCGGTVLGPIGDGGGTDGTTGGDGGGGGGCTGTPPSCFCGSPKCVNGQWGCTDCGNDCNALQMQIAVEQNKLSTCCPTCKSIQCQSVAQGPCCPFTTNGGDTSNLDALVMKYKANCKFACPAIPCPPAPSGICDPSQMDPNAGHCR
jgi:hypothetical protein